MSSPPLPPGSAGSPYRISPARICSIAFTVFTLTIAYCSYIDYCVLQPVYFAKSEIQVAQSRDPASPNPVRAEIEFISSPDVMSPIVTDLQLDRIWAKRIYKSSLDALPMQDALGYFKFITQIQQVPGTNIVTIRVASDLPKEASDLANAIANRYQTEREKSDDQVFARKESILGDQIAQQQKVVDQQSATVEKIRTQPGSSHITNAADPLAPMRDAQSQFDAQQRALDDLQRQLLQAKVDHQLGQSPVIIIALAEPPEYPSAPNHSLDLMIAIAEGIVLALLAAALGEFAFWYVARISPPGSSPPHISISPAHPSAEY